MQGEIINIIIAGTGGQGVNTLYSIILSLCARKKIYSKSALFKGGAQRHGTVHATIRIFKDDRPGNQWYTSQIMKGHLDLLIGLEPWETLRFCKFACRETSIWSNSMIVPLFGDRNEEIHPDNPVEILKRLPNKVNIDNYSEKAIDKFNDLRMANFLLGIKIFDAGILPFTKDEFIKEFLKVVNPSDEIENLVNKEFVWTGEMQKK